MLLATTALSGLMAGAIQTAPLAPPQQQPAPPLQQRPPATGGQGIVDLDRKSTRLNSSHEGSY